MGEGPDRARAPSRRGHRQRPRRSTSGRPAVRRWRTRARLHGLGRPLHRPRPRRAARLGLACRLERHRRPALRQPASGRPSWPRPRHPPCRWRCSRRLGCVRPRPQASVASSKHRHTATVSIVRSRANQAVRPRSWTSRYPPRARPRTRPSAAAGRRPLPPAARPSRPARAARRRPTGAGRGRRDQGEAPMDAAEEGAGSPPRSPAARTRPRPPSAPPANEPAAAAANGITPARPSAAAGAGTAGSIVLIIVLTARVHSSPWIRRRPRSGSRASGTRRRLRRGVRLDLPAMIGMAALVGAAALPPAPPICRSISSSCWRSTSRAASTPRRRGSSARAMSPPSPIRR